MQLWLAEGKMRINISWWHFKSYPSGSDRSRMAWTSHWFPHPLLSNYLCAQVCPTFSPGLKCQYHFLLIACLLFPWETGISLCIVSLLTFHNSDLSDTQSSFLLLWMRIVMSLRAGYHRNKDSLKFFSSPLAKTPIFYFETIFPFPSSKFSLLGSLSDSLSNIPILTPFIKIIMTVLTGLAILFNDCDVILFLSNFYFCFFYFILYWTCSKPTIAYNSLLKMCIVEQCSCTLWICITLSG